MKDWTWWSDFLQREYYAGPSEARGWEVAAASVAAAVDQKPGMRVLDLGSGSGEMIFQLALRGADAVGIEMSSTLVEHCRRRGADLGVAAQFIDANMFELDREMIVGDSRLFDVVLSLNTSFGYGTDRQNRDLIASIGTWLRPGGIFYCDLCVADNAQPFGRWSDRVAGGTLIVDNEYDRGERLMISDPSWVAPGGTIYTATSPERVRLYYRDEIEETMRAASMEPVRLRRAMGRSFRQTDDQMMTTWIARRMAELGPQSSNA